MYVRIIHEHIIDMLLHIHRGACTYAYIVLHICLRGADASYFWFLSPDPSMTVRTDIVGKYHNRKYAYEPDDVDFCECLMRPVERQLTHCCLAPM